MLILSVFFFNDTATTESYTLSLHDALPIFAVAAAQVAGDGAGHAGIVVHAQQDRSAHGGSLSGAAAHARPGRSEEHTSELQSRQYLVCRLLLEKKKTYRLKSLHAMCSVIGQ